ncbi:MAG TPA: hypothetical protein VGF94_14150 [Kofleriaceae bacterium]
MALAACGPKPAPNAVTPDEAIVYVRANVREAQVFLDGRLVGPLRAVRGGIAVGPGRHRLELRADDYFSRYVMLDLGKAERRKLQLDMAPVLP